MRGHLTHTRVWIGVAGLLALAGAARAQTWNGAGANDLFNTPGNWVGGVAPQNNGTASVIMTGTVRLAPTVTPAHSVASLSFPAGAGGFNMFGTMLTVGAGGISVESAETQRLSLPIQTPATGLQTWTINGGGLRVFSPVTLASSLVIDGSGPMGFFAAVSAPQTLIKSGTGELQIGGALSNPNGLTMNGGTLRLMSSNVLLDSGFLTLNGSSVFDLNGQSESLGHINGTSGTTINIPSGSILTLSGTLPLGFAGTITGGATGSLVLSQSLSLGGVSTLPGFITIQNGSLVLSAAESLSDVCTVSVLGGSLALANGPETIGLLRTSGGSITGGSGASIIAGALEIGGGTIGVRLAGPGTMTLNASTTTVLSAPAAHTGGTAMNAGTLRLATSNALPATGGVSVGSGATLLLDLGVSLSLPGISGMGTANLGNVSILELGAGGASQTLGLSVTGTGSLAKVGTGTLTLPATLSHTGGVRIDAGVVEASGAASLGGGTSPLILRGGTLRATGTIEWSREVSVVGPGTSTLDAQAAISLSGSITQSTGGNLAKVGPGTLTLSSSGSVVGAVNLNESLTRLVPGAALSTLGPLTIGTGARLDAGGASLTSPLVVCNGTLDLPGVARFSLNNAGLTTGAGRLEGSLNNMGAGTLRITRGSAVQLTGTGQNAGFIEVIEADLEVAGTFTNYGGGTSLIYARDATLRFNGGLFNQGPIAVAAGVAEFFGDVTNQAGGSIIVSGGGDAVFLDDVVNQGSIRTSVGCNAVFLGALSGLGSYPGAGTVYIEGDLRPGASPGIVDFGGDLVLGQAGALVAELAGSGPGQFDQVRVAGTAWLDGTLDLRTLGGFRPGPGERLAIITAGAVRGGFAAVVRPAEARTLRVLVGPTRVDVVDCRADLNTDGVLDPDDLADFIACYFTSPPCAVADYDGDGETDPDDLSDYISGYFAGCA